MLTLEECIEMSDLSPPEVAAIAEHEHVDLIIAAEMGAHLLRSPEGEKRIACMIAADLKRARRRGDRVHADHLGQVLESFVHDHGDVEYE